MKHLIIVTISLSFLVVTQGLSQADQSRIKNFNIDDDRLALQGYDPVSYFDGEPKEGLNDLVYVYRGIQYVFASADNLRKFKLAPENFEPAYGGWCAFAMGTTGEKVKVDPETFKIADGRLYLFYNFWTNNTLEDWNKDETRLKTSADRNWKKIAGGQ